MSPFPESGRSDTAITVEFRGRFRPNPAVPRQEKPGRVGLSIENLSSARCPAPYPPQQAEGGGERPSGGGDGENMDFRGGCAGVRQVQIRGIVAELLVAEILLSFRIII